MDELLCNVIVVTMICLGVYLLVTTPKEAVCAHERDVSVVWWQ